MINKSLLFFPSSLEALESLGFGSYIAEVKDVLQECKTVALKRRKASSRLENLGIPEEELLRQQQELFAKVSSTNVTKCLIIMAALLCMCVFVSCGCENIIHSSVGDFKHA